MSRTLRLKMNYKMKILAVMTLLIFLFTLNSCQEKKEPEESREDLQKKQGIPVEAVTVKKGDILITIEVSGGLEAEDSITVSTNNEGRIEQVFVKEGDYVKANQIVAVIEPDDLQDQTLQAEAALNAAKLRFSQAQSNALLQETQIEGSIKQAEQAVKAAEAQYKQAKASLKSSQENLSLVEEGARTQEIAQAEQAVVQADANLREADIDLGRMERLYEKGAVAKQQLDVAQVKYDVVKAQYNSALEQLDLVKEGARSQEIETAKQQVNISEASVAAALASLEQAKEALNTAIAGRIQITVANQSTAVAQAEVEQAEANLARITRDLEKSYVKTMVSGYVTEKYVEPGEYTSGPGATDIIDVFDPATLYFRGIVSETDIVNVSKGLTVDIEIDGLKDKKFTGTIQDIIPKASESRQFTVKISVVNPGSDIKPGMFARGEVLLSTHKDVLIVPNDAIVNKNGGKCIFLIKEDLTVTQKEVIPGPSVKGNTEIFQGVEAGDKIVYTGSVKDGDLVKIIKEE